MLSDRHHRLISYLRVSVTERCNLRCMYCMPAEGIALSSRDQLLTYEEIARVARVGAGLGLSKIRLTGGEPTVRSELPRLVRMLSAIDGVREISMTTNGSLLDEMAVPLKRAGLHRVNISLDSLRRERAAELARRDVLPAVLRGIDAAIAAGLGPVKLNCVVMRGVNDDELCDLVSFAHSLGAQMRFIEYMPMGEARLDPHNRTVPASEMLDRLSGCFDLERETPADAASDPARGWVCRRSGARVGFITSMSEHFCGTCNRMRLTAEGGLRPCLHQDAEVDVRAILREPANASELDSRIADAFRAAADRKWAGHHMTDFIPLFSRKEMVAIGG